MLFVRCILMVLLIPLASLKLQRSPKMAKP